MDTSVYSDTKHIMRVLQHLMAHLGLSANALAKELRFPTPTISRLLTGEVQDPRASTLITIADYFGIKVDQLLGKEPLDKKFIRDGKASGLVIKPPLSIPILTITEAINYQKHYQKPNAWLRWQPQLKDDESVIHDNIFAVVIKNNLYEPIFFNGTFLIANPNIVPINGDYVLINFLGDSSAIVKKYLAEGHQKYLCSLKTDL